MADTGEPVEITDIELTEMDLCPPITFALLLEQLRSAAKELDGDGMELMLDAFIAKTQRAEDLSALFNPSLHIAAGDAPRLMREMAQHARNFIVTAREYEKARAVGHERGKRMGFGAGVRQVY